MSDYETYKRWSNNCYKLAELMRNLPRERHEQRHWGMTDEVEIDRSSNTVRYGCGTAGCALGWATLSGQFEGLSERPSLFGTGPTATIPLSNGQETSWRDVGRTYFGHDAWLYIFSNGDIGRDTIVSRLTEYADQYCTAARNLKETHDAAGSDGRDQTV